MQHPLTRQAVLDTRDALPAFPQVVMQILQTLDDPDACLSLLTRQVETDAIISARVLSLCNRAARQGTVRGPVDDVFTALQLVGLARVREMAVTIKLGDFLKDIVPAQAMAGFWSHSLACAVCGVELAHYTGAEVGVDSSLITCLLHDVGQLWLQRFMPEGTSAARQLAMADDLETDAAEREIFGVDHGQVGEWLAQCWGLSPGICQGIRHHHQPEKGLPEPLVAVAHVAEVLSQALNLSSLTTNRVRTISAPACARLGLDWGDDSQSLFGRIDARSRHAFAPYEPADQAVSAVNATA